MAVPATANFRSRQINALQVSPVRVGSTTYVPIPVQSLLAHPVVDFDVYLNVARSIVLYLDKNFPAMHGEMVDRMLRNDVTTLYINAADRGRFLEYSERYLSATLSDKALPAEEKSVVLYSAITNMAASIFEGAISQEKISLTARMASHMVDQVLETKSALFNLMRLMAHSYEVSNHCVHVCAYSVALGQHLNSLDQNYLHQLAHAALLHDVGKSRIDKQILNKEGPLSETEWNLMRYHPAWGLEILESMGPVADVLWDAVMQHHERCDGSGYPNGLKESDLSLTGRLVMLADIYDTLTCGRAFRKAYSPFEALSAMREQMAGRIDDELFRHFVLLLGGN